MGGIIDKITDFIKEMLQGWVLNNLDTMFSDVNDKVGTIAGEVSKTPSTWNSGIFSMIRTLSENVVVPIAGMIISFVLIYELITMVIDKNNMHDFDTSLFFRFLFKACGAGYGRCRLCHHMASHIKHRHDYIKSLGKQHDSDTSLK